MKTKKSMFYCLEQEKRFYHLGMKDKEEHVLLFRAREKILTLRYVGQRRACFIIRVKLESLITNHKSRITIYEIRG